MKSEIKFADEKVLRSFEALKDSKTENQRLYKWICRAFEDLEEIGILTPYSVEIRYPDNSDDIEETEAEEAYELAVKVKQFVDNIVN